MVDARAIRALVVRNKTSYFFGGAVQRGATGNQRFIYKALIGLGLVWQF